MEKRKVRQKLRRWWKGEGGERYREKREGIGICIQEKGRRREKD